MKYNLKIGKEDIQVDSKYFRPTEVDLLIGDATKAKEKLGWVPEYTLKELVNEMMTSDIKMTEKEQYLKLKGLHTNNYFEWYLKILKFISQDTMGWLVPLVGGY